MVSVSQFGKIDIPQRINLIGRSEAFSLGILETIQYIKKYNWIEGKSFRLLIWDIRTKTILKKMEVPKFMFS